MLLRADFDSGMETVIFEDHVSLKLFGKQYYDLSCRTWTVRCLLFLCWRKIWIVMFTTRNLGFKDDTNLSQNVHISSPKLIKTKIFRHPFCCQSLVAKRYWRRKKKSSLKKINLWRFFLSRIHSIGYILVSNEWQNIVIKGRN